MRWEGPGSGFQSSSAGGVWNSGIFKTHLFAEFEKWDPDISVIFPNPCVVREVEKRYPDIDVQSTAADPEELSFFCRFEVHIFSNKSNTCNICQRKEI